MQRSRSSGQIEQEIEIPLAAARLPGIFGAPIRPKGLVIFAHGSGSGRLSPRNNYVAWVLQESGLATLLVDLLEEPESLDRRKVFALAPGFTTTRSTTTSRSCALFLSSGISSPRSIC